MADGQAAPVSDLAALVGPLWSQDRAASALGLDPEGFADVERSGALLGLPTADGDPVYPVSQFVRLPDDSTSVRSSVVAVLSVLQGYDRWTVATVLVTPADELDGATPMAWIHAGGAPEVLLGWAEQVAREWAAG